MDTDRSSLELLGHFDRPKRVISPDFDWDDNAVVAEEFCPALTSVEELARSLGARCAQPQPLVTEQPAPVRGADWVLQWAGAVLVLAIAVGVLGDFARGVGVEHALRIAVRAGATEATLPKATYASVAAAIERRLAAYPELKQNVQLTMLQNGVPVGERFRANGGDQIAVSISAPARSLAAGWMGKLALWRGGSLTIVQAESQVPGRRVPLLATHR